MEESTEDSLLKEIQRKGVANSKLISLLNEKVVRLTNVLKEIPRLEFHIKIASNVSLFWNIQEKRLLLVADGGSPKGILDQPFRVQKLIGENWTHILEEINNNLGEI